MHDGKEICYLGALFIPRSKQIASSSSAGETSAGGGTSSASAGGGTASAGGGTSSVTTGGGASSAAAPQSITQTLGLLEFGKGTLTLDTNHIELYSMATGYYGDDGKEYVNGDGGEYLTIWWFKIKKTDIYVALYPLQLRFFRNKASIDPAEAHFIIFLDAQQVKILDSFLEGKLYGRSSNVTISMPFSKATLIPLHVVREAFNVPMETTIDDFLLSNCRGIFNDDLVPAPTSSVPGPSSALSPVRQQAQAMSRVDVQLRHEAFRKLLSNCDPPRCRIIRNPQGEEIERVITVYQRFFTVRENIFKLVKQIVFGEGVEESTYYTVKMDKIEKEEKEGSLHVGLRFFVGKPNYILGNGFYNLLTSEAMRGIALEMLCYLLRTMENETPWVDHGFRDKPTLFGIAAYGGGPRSQSKVATYSSVRRLVRYYERWGFRRRNMILYTSNSLAFKLKDGDLTVYAFDERDGGEGVQIIKIPNLSPEVISLFIRLYQED